VDLNFRKGEAHFFAPKEATLTKIGAKKYPIPVNKKNQKENPFMTPGVSYKYIYHAS
jgi:hypothetical protein